MGKTSPQSPAGANHDPVKPEPPNDLWEQLDAIHMELNIQVAVGGFTVEEYAAKFKLAYGTAYRRIKTLVDAGRVSFIGKRISPAGRLLNVYDLKKESK